jgi:hypothetical protein
MKCKFCNEKNFIKKVKSDLSKDFYVNHSEKTFVERDKRGCPMIEAKSIAIVMYSQCKVSIRAIYQSF